MDINRDYHKEKLTYVDDLLLDSYGSAIMMGWEAPIMKHQAELICKNGGDILNVGFGLGLIDTYIQSHNISTHWIVESHPDVYNKIVNDGWLSKPNVKVIFKPWQEAIHDLPKFDGIYFDTWLEDQSPFNKIVPNLLKPNGIFSFFNNYSHHINNISVENYEDLNFNFNIINHPIPHPEETIHNKLKDKYVKPNKKTYFSPECTLK
tara:strand:+ start:3466 stop:4083 length:618 start_codon:yes stop_codon:yes gene_type:complete